MLFNDGRLRVVALASMDDSATLLISGEIDRSNSDRLGAILAEVQVTTRPAGDAMVVDLAEVSFVDLSGLRVLALIPGVPREQAPRVLNMPPFVQRLLGLLGPDGDEGGRTG
ncbi:hypothetical protein DP939_40240 [Spongiactinospora rosea]|uniref:STAS domain-containing protein n=1 Tax=Spongiactinospora rosea TaxID=2248750 RepID=A0A366LKQ0_9ACTN|nr:hypothetical protein DP939_40240 [Spongiactinospora rosea]